MRDDYRWIFEQAGEHILFNEDAEQALRDILLEAEGHAEDITEKLGAAINIVLFEAGPECHFTEIEDDAGHSLGIGERIPDPEHHGRVKIRITAKNIIDMRDAT